MVILQLEEQPPLIQAIFTGEVDAVRKLLESKQDVNYQDFEKRSALHAAAFRGDPIITKLLIDHGARVNTKDCKWVTPLHRACYSGSEETVTILLNNSADTCARDRLWQTPLHIAAACNSLECVSYLLDRIQNPNVTDRSGRTALHHAVLNGHNDIVELLISRGCIVNACDKKDCRPMHWAAYKGHIETVEILLQHGADINAKDRNQYTPLHVAAASGAVSVIDVLVENGADVEAQNAYGNTPLHVACLNGHGNLAAELVRYRCDKEARNYKGQTPLHLAAASTHGVHCLNLLVSQNVDINKQSLDGRTPLHMTAIHGRFTRSKTLIDKGATVDCADRNGCTALHIAAHYGHELLSNTLLSYGAQPARKGFEGRTPLHMCCLSGYIECCRIFIKAGVDLNDKDDTGKTPLHCAAYKGAVECVDLLVSSGADFRVTDMVGRTALHYASAQGFFFCVFTLVGIGSPVNQADKEGRTALHLAAAYDIDGRCVNYLIEHKADPKLKDVNGFTPIHYAVAGNNVNALKYLLYAVGNCALSGPDMPLTTPLHIAARNGNTEMLEKLMPYLSDPNVRNEHGCTPLLMAARHGYASCVQMLLRFGAKVSICDIPNGLSPVHHSAKNGHVHCLALLVDNAEDKSIIDLADNLRRTALMLAVSNSHTDCVTTLIKSGADPNIVDGDGHTCLFRAVVTGQHNILQMLLPRSTIVNERDIHGKTALHVAAGCGRLSCVQRILPYMDEQVKESTDRQDCTALHWACYSGSAECVAHFFNEHIFRQMKGNAFSPVHCAASIGAEKCLELLCAQYGPEIVKLKDDRARTPLHVAALHGQCDCAKFLLEQGADVNRQDEDGKTPLISAAFNGQVQIIEILIGNKADVTFSDKNGNTALHIACLRRHSNAALLLLEFITTPEIINMTNNERKTALHLTARNGLVDVTRRLIAKGSSVTAVDANGLTPAFQPFGAEYGLTPALCCAPNTNVAQCLAIILASHSAQNTAANGKEPFPVGLGLNYLKTDARTSTSTLKSGENRTLQTDITMLRDPDQFELERMFEIKFRKTDADPSPSSSSSEDDDGSRFFIHYRSQEDILDIGQTRTELASRSSAHELHGSHSDTALTPDTYGTGLALLRPRIARVAFRYGADAEADLFRRGLREDDQTDSIRRLSERRCVRAPDESRPSEMP
ncbi:Ankyrin repeats (3 copies) [Popillia japonica]|uniref:Ankyrin repeats (3 copies) n=1 Tax=Popillia japonica TaxID=7064 RepID=A0AAW1NAE0_POPJA